MDACPNCGSSQPAWHARKVDDEPKIDLARVTSVAEAGYLVSLLEEAQIPASARPAESFNAVNGSWSPTYHVSVPTSEAEAAGRILQAESRGEFAEIAEQVFRPADASHETPTVNPWRMLTVLAIVAAAGAAFVSDRLGGRAQPVRRDQAPDANKERKAESLASLVAALRDSPAPLMTRGGAIGPHQELRYSQATGALILSIDADRDGRFETHRRFTATPAEP